MHYKLTIRNTCVVVEPGDDAMSVLGPVVTNLTYEDEFVEKTVTLGIMHDTKHDKIYIHKGIDIDFLKKLLVNVEVIDDTDYEGLDMNFHFEELIAPRNNEQRDVINFIAGEESFVDNKTDPRLFVVKQPGFGKMQPFFSRIPTPNGYTTMGRLRIGDTVFTDSGHTAKVKKIYDHGPQMVYRVEFADGRHVYCGDEHLWCVRDDEDKIHTKPLYEIRSSYMNYMGRNKYRYSVNRCGYVQYPWLEYNVDPWTYGVCVMLTNHDDKRLLFDANDDNVDDMMDLVDRLCRTNDWKSTFKDNKFTFVDKYGRHINHDDIFTEGIFRIPDCYRISSNRSATLGGIVEVALCINGKASIESKLKSLIDDVMDMFHSTGNYAKRRIKDEIAIIDFGCDFRLIAELSPSVRWKVHYKFDKILLKRYNERNYIKNITEVGTYQCRCIEVDSITRLYLTDDYIVTHNTYCTGYGIGLYGKKALIIMHRDSLRTQWNESLFMMNGFEHRYVHEIDNTQELYNIAIGEYTDDYDVYLITHATFRAGLKRIGDLEVAQNICKNLGIGVKIIDEAHLEFKDILLLDFICNVKRNIYLTATPGRSQRDENTIYWNVFKPATFYAPSNELNADTRNKWMVYTTVRLSTECPPNIYRYQVNRGKGMNPASYGKWVIARDKRKRHFKCCKELIMECFDRDENAKVLVLIPLIALCDSLMDFLIEELDKEDRFRYALSIRTINSTNSKQDNENNKKADVIISTIGSMGVGMDVKGLTDIINMTPYCSKLTAEQSLGRVRYAGKVGHYYDIIDTSVQMDVFWWRSRSKTLKNLSMKNEIFDWHES